MPQPPYIEPIQYIRFDEQNYPIDAITINGRSVNEFQESEKIVTSINSSSTDEQIPSAKCLYDMIYGSVESVYGRDYLTYDIVDGGTVVWKRSNSNTPNKTISYRINNGSWQAIDSTIEGTSFSVNTGDKVEFKGTNNGYSNNAGNCCSLSGTAKFNLSGNIMSLIGGDNFENISSFSTSFVFNGLFENSNAIDASKLVLPTRTYTSCYNRMFANCKNLIYPPALPSTILSSSCYYSMFSGCSSLIKAPVLPATVMATYCYYSMFWGCTSLTSAPTLKSTTLAQNCYSNMFFGCTSLTNAPDLPATIMMNSCYSGMFSGCTSLTMAPVLSGIYMATRCYQSMFSNCTNLRVAPKLPSTNLASYCYNGMFSSCSNLTVAPTLPATIMMDSCYYQMFSGCINLTKAPALPATTLNNYCYGSMFSGCTSLTTTPVLPATTLASNCYSYMFSTCTSLTTAPILPSTNLKSYCYQGMFNNCTSLTTAPALPAETLANYCYNGMFKGCNRLISAPVLPAKTLYTGCYQEMFYGCSRLTNIECYATYVDTNNHTANWTINIFTSGTFTGYAGVGWKGGTSGIPYTWTSTLIDLYRPESSHTIGMYVDDFLLGNPVEFVNDPVGHDCRAYEYTGEDIGFDGDDFYLWKQMSITSSNGPRYGPYYALTSTINQNTLQGLSLESSITNVFEQPIYAFLYMDTEEYGSGGGYSIVSVSQTTGLEMWIDDDFEYGMEGDGYYDMEEYLDWYLNNIEESGSRHYYYIDEFEYDGETCYLWCCYVDNRYMVTDTNNLQTLQSYSIEYDYSNVNTHPILAFLNPDLTEYGRSVDDASIVKVTSTQPKLMMYVDDFIKNDINVDDFIDDPESMGSNYYEYCEEFEYDGDTYYVWEFIDTPNSSIGHINRVKYLLTDTANYQTLQNDSFEEDQSNLVSSHIITYLDMDLEETYTGLERLDTIIKMVEIVGIYSAGTLGMYIDDFPDYAWEDNGNQDIYEFIDEYMNNPTDGGNYYEYCEPFTYDGDTYYIWILTDNGYNNVDNNNNLGQIKYVLTDTINFQTLYNSSLEEDIYNIDNDSHLVCFINEDLEGDYDCVERNDHIVTVFEL